MPKTCISVSAVGKAQEIVKGFIDKNGWPISTIITKPDSVSIYFSYKWFQYCEVRKFKKAVKNYAKRVTYYDRTSIPKYLFAQETRPSSDKLQEALTEFSYTAAVQGGIGCGDVEAITNDDGVVIGYKR